MFLKDSFPSLRDAHINFGKAEFDSLAKELESRERFKNVSCYANNIRCNVRSFEQTYKRVNHILISGYDMIDMLASVTVISKALSDNFDIPLTRRIENAENEDYVIPESVFFGLNGFSKSENEAGGVSDDEYDKYFGDEDDEAEEYEEAEEYKKPKNITMMGSMTNTALRILNVVCRNMSCMKSRTAKKSVRRMTKQIFTVMKNCRLI